MSINVGQRFGMLRVTRIDKVGRVTCVCDCGGACVVHGKELRSGARTSCGCKSQTNGFTAAQIAQGELEPLGKRITAHLEKVRGYEAEAHEKAGVELRKADDHWNTVTQLLDEAKAKCNGGGFKAFKKKYCPNLGRSRIYELLLIGSGKKTIEESRGATRDRVRKHRAKSVTSADVTDTDDKTVATATDSKDPCDGPSAPPDPAPTFTETPTPHSEGPDDVAALAEGIKSAVLNSHPAGVGPYSAGENDRLLARIDELNAEKRRLEIKVAGLESEVRELETANRMLKTRIAELEKSPTPETALAPVELAPEPTTVPSNTDEKSAAVAGEDLTIPEFLRRPTEESTT